MSYQKPLDELLDLKRLYNLEGGEIVIYFESDVIGNNIKSEKIQKLIDDLVWLDYEIELNTKEQMEQRISKEVEDSLYDLFGKDFLDMLVSGGLSYEKNVSEGVRLYKISVREGEEEYEYDVEGDSVYHLYVHELIVVNKVLVKYNNK